MPNLWNTLMKGIRAYHGSPHDFSKFELDKIGTGQGAQAYGHGLYFAENPEVARSYQKELTDLKDRALEGYPDLSLPSWVAKTVESKNPQAFADMKTDFSGRLAEMKRQLADPNTPQPWNINVSGIENILKALELHQSGVPLKPPGRMYEVDIRAHPEQFLNWDRPIGEGVAAQLPSSLIEKAQKEAYSRALAATSKSRADELWDMTKNPAQAPGEFLYRQLHRETYPIRPDLQSPWQASGAASYEEALDKVGGNKSLVQTVITPDPAYASQTLNEAGIPGIKYLDQGSRGTAGGTSNYVVFNPDIVDILKKYGIAGVAPMAVGFGFQPTDNQQQQ